MPRPPSRRTRSIDDLRRIAHYQRVLIVCILGQLLCWVAYIAYFAFLISDPVGPGGDSEEVPLIAIFVITGLLGVVGAVFVGLMGTLTNGPIFGVLLGAMTLIPCVSLFMILIANSQATSVLKKNDVRVGFLGARAADITERQVWDDDELPEEDRPRRRRGYAEIDEDEGW